MKLLKLFAGSLLLLLVASTVAFASEADLKIPRLTVEPGEKPHFVIFNQPISAFDLLFWGALVITGTLGISLYQLWQIHRQALKSLHPMNRDDSLLGEIHPHPAEASRLIG